MTFTFEEKKHAINERMGNGTPYKEIAQYLSDNYGCSGYKNFKSFTRAVERMVQREIKKLKTEKQSIVTPEQIMEEKFEVEESQDRRKKNRKYEYKVKWAGYDKPTWVKALNLKNAQEAKKDFDDLLHCLSPCLVVHEIEKPVLAKCIYSIGEEVLNSIIYSILNSWIQSV